MKQNTKISLISVSLVLFMILMNHQSMGQEKKSELKKEVEVVKPYEPSVPEVFKINEIPQIRHQETEKPSFEYTIKPSPVFSTFNVEPVQAARMVDESEPEGGQGLLKLGIGNYKTPYGEIFYNTGTGKTTTFGTHFRHLSSHGNIRLKNGDQVKAPASDNHAELFLNHFFSDSTTLKAKLFFDRQGFRYYGYPGEQIDNEAKELLIPFWNQKQAISRGGINLQLNGSNKQGFNYDAGLSYQHYGSITGQKGNLVRLGGQINKGFDLFRGRLDAYLTIEGTDSVYSETSDVFTQREKVVLELNPSVSFETDMASLKLGINSYTVTDADKVEDFMLAPNIKASWSPVENWLTLFAGTDGYLQQNHYLSIINENQFVNPYHNIKNAMYRYILTGGIQGRVTSQMNYKFQVDYSSIRDYHFYILKNRYTPNDLFENELTTRSNTFDVVYDKVKQLSIGGEIHYAASEMFDFLLTGNYYSYETNSQAEAWQQPGFEASASVRLKPEGPFSFTADVYYVGERKALIAAELYDTQSAAYEPYPDGTTIWNMDAILDMNFSIEYEFTKQLSFWTRVNNFSAQKYDRWQGYTGKGINLLLGLSYTF
jgi:hypothetical protein